MTTENRDDVAEAVTARDLSRLPAKTILSIASPALDPAKVIEIEPLDLGPDGNGHILPTGED